MKRLLHVASLATTLIWHAPADAQTLYSCGHGTIRGVEAVIDTVTRDTVTTRRGDEGLAAIVVQRTDHITQRTVVIRVQLNDRVIVSQSAGDPYATLDPMELVAGDPIDVCASATLVILERPDGKDYRAPVIRQEIVAAPATPRITR